MPMISKLFTKLRDPEYRKAFVASQVNIGVPFQLRALMRSRGWTQKELAERTGMLQPRISAMLKPGKTRPNIETLRRLAEAFDCGLIVRFAPFSELTRWSERFDPESFEVPSFAEEPLQNFGTTPAPLPRRVFGEASRGYLRVEKGQTVQVGDYNLDALVQVFEPSCQRFVPVKPPEHELSWSLYEHDSDEKIKKIQVPRGSSDNTGLSETLMISQVS